MHWYGNPNIYSTCRGVSQSISGNTGHRGSSWQATRYFASGNRHRISETVQRNDSDFWSGCNHRYGNRHRYWVYLHNSLCGNRRRFWRYEPLPARNTNYDWGKVRVPIPDWWYGRLHILLKYLWLCDWGLQSDYNCSDGIRHRYWVCSNIHWHDKPSKPRLYASRLTDR